MNRRRINIIFIALAIITIMYGCKSLSDVRYDKAYEVIRRERDYTDKEYYIRNYGKDLSGVYVYDSVYAVYKDSLFGALLTSNLRGGKPLYRDLYLSKLSKKYYNKNWFPVSELKKFYDEKNPDLIYKFIYKKDSISPPRAVVFSPIENNELRADVIPFFIKKPLYFGTVRQYYFKFKGRKIIQQQRWIAHCEGFW